MTYLGVKMIEAEPMTNIEASMVLDRPVGTEDESAGYLVSYPDGYRSWSPRDVFESAYFPLADEAGRKISLRTSS